MSNSLIGIAYAQDAPSTAPSAHAAGLSSLIPLLLIFAIFYFLLIRPQQREKKAHQEMIKNLKRGDEVITTGGIHGVISEVREDTFKVKITPNVVIEVSKSAIASKKEPPGTAQPQVK
jgi:preprotein translocase subunit YajC